MGAELSALPGGALRLYKTEDGQATVSVLLDAQTSSTAGAALRLYDGSGSETISMEAETGYMRINGNLDVTDIVPSSGLLIIHGTTETDVLRITGGSDIAEPFNVNSYVPIKPGMVVAIDPDRSGELRVADRAYDPTVAGIISGAGGVNAGMTLQQKGTAADGSHPVALTGRVYCWCDADVSGSIQPGDMLTTSTTPGHAMKAGDRTRAFGSIIGKAMTSLTTGKGLVLVLVSLQ